MSGEYLCEPCTNLIDQASNGDTLTLCPECLRKYDAVQHTIGWRAVTRREVVHLNFDPPVIEPLESDAENIDWVVIAVLGVGIFIIALALLVLWLWPTVKGGAL